MLAIAQTARRVCPAARGCRGARGAQIVAAERNDRSRDGLGEQFGQAGEIIGTHGEGELPTDPGQPAMAHLAQAGDDLGPAENLLDAFADALRDVIAGWRVVRPSIAERRRLVFCAT